jgi:hypothetical protein
MEKARVKSEAGAPKPADEGNAEPTGWALKDAMVAIPFLASGLALTWEVGFFLRIKGSAFGLFSITEHITFALQALPFAMVAAVIFVGCAVYYEVFSITVGPNLRRMPIEQINALNRRWLAAVVVVCILCAVGSRFMPFRSVTILVACALYASIYGLVVLTPTVLSRKMTTTIAMLFSMFIFTFAVGIDIAQNELESDRPLNVIETGRGYFSVRILRTGDKGVLYFDPKKESFGLLRWDDVKSIDWSISQLLKP